MKMMKNPFFRNRAKEKKSYGSFVAISMNKSPVWTSRNYVSLAREAYEKNVIAYRCIRMIAESAASAPMGVMEKGSRLSGHPVLDLLARPNPEQSGTELLESLYGFLQTSGNGYMEAVLVNRVPAGLYVLRPDRIKIRVGKDGWPESYDYTAGTRKIKFMHNTDPGKMRSLMHMKLFHPLNDYYGQSPLEAASSSVDVHNAAGAWNKSLLDNAARPSGALVYNGPEGAENLNAEQYDRLKGELEGAYQGAGNAGRPMLLDGGLDWKSMSLSPSDMDFISAKNTAAREIALAFGVPPMLLGIPGDNTYANYKEANLAFWKQTVLPLVKKTASAITRWFSPAYPGCSVVCHTEDIEALSTERDGLWARISNAQFLDDHEKRHMLGISPRE